MQLAVSIREDSPLATGRVGRNNRRALRRGIRTYLNVFPAA